MARRRKGGGGGKRLGLPGMLWRLLVAGGVAFALAGAAAYAVVYVLVKVPEVEAPDLVGLDAAAALDKASAEGFRVRVAERRAAPGLAPGAVAAQRPLPGDWVKEGATIHLVLAEE